MLRVKHLIYRNSFGFFLVVILGCLCASIVAPSISWEKLTTVMGGVGVFFYFVQKQQMEEVRLSKELFGDFNARYDQLNERLNRIITKPDAIPLDQGEVDDLYSYFNLCGEEYLYFREGVLKPAMWESWLAGMKIFFSNRRVKELWGQERQTGSYYGLELVFSDRE